MTSVPPPDWQLPPGVTRGLWEYTHDPALAASYDQSLAGSALLARDSQFVALHCPQPGRVLDLGCGTGRSLLPLAQRNFWAVGVDLSLAMLRVARDKAQTLGVTLHLVQANVTCLEGLADGSFDYVLCLFSTLGMIHGKQHRQRVLDHAARLLRPGGKLLVHGHNRWFNCWTSAGRRWLVGNTLQAWFGRAEAGDRWLPAHQGISGWTMHLFTRGELVRMVTATGLTIVEVVPVGLGLAGSLRWPGLLPTVRAHGYLLAAQK